MKYVPRKYLELPGLEAVYSELVIENSSIRLIVPKDVETMKQFIDQLILLDSLFTKITSCSAR